MRLNLRFRQGIELTYGARTQEVYDAYLVLFAALPLAVRTPNRVFVCHTLPDARYLDDLDLALLKADHWPEEAMKRGGTIYALTWGRDTTPETANRFAEMVDADWFVTGHQPCEDGLPPGQPSPDHYRRNQSLPGLLPLRRNRLRHDRVAAQVDARHGPARLELTPQHQIAVEIG